MPLGELNVLLEQLTTRTPTARLHQPAHEVLWNTVTTICRPVELWLDLQPAGISRP